jgi:hypothetical protein
MSRRKKSHSAQDASTPVDPDQIALWLNRNPDSASARRLTALIREVMDAISARQSRSKELPKKILAINRRLRTYTATPALQIPHDLSEQLRPTWLPTIGEGHDEPFEYGEFQFVLGVMRLAREDRLGRLRRCRHDEQWFFAKLKRQVFCSQHCQQAHFRQTPTFKKYHADQMRSWRKLQKSDF